MKKTILITGASSGIGKATAVFFQQQGWNVAATMRTPEKEQELGSLPGIKIYPLDVSDEDSIYIAVQNILRDFGSLDVLLNNAGYGAVGPFEAASSHQVRKQFDTNVFGLMNVTRAVLPHFRSKKQGIVINVSSMAGRITFPLYSLYNGTKWAVEGFSEALQFELAPFGIRIKLVEPGVIKTDFYDRSQELFRKEGLTVYDDYTTTVLHNMQKPTATAPGPEIVARTIYRAATDGSKKLRYTTGIDSSALLFLRWLLPLRVFNKIVRVVLER